MMSSSRMLPVVGLSVLTLAFFGGSATVGQNENLVESSAGAQTMVREPIGPSDAVAELALEVKRLRERLDRNPVAQDVSRNPFLLIRSQSESATPQSQSGTNIVQKPNDSAVSPTPAVGTTLSFIGIAVEDGQRAAIFLLDDGQIVVAGTGGAVANGSRVIAIEDAAVSVVDSVGVLRRYELR